MRVLALLLLTGYAGGVDFLCPTLFNFYADPYSCAKFYRCYWGAAMHFTCPPGTRWNVHVATCDHHANVICRARGLVPVRHPGFWAGFATMNLHAGDYARYRAYHNSRLRAGYGLNYYTGAARYNTGYKHPYRRHKFYARINSYKDDDKYSPLIRNWQSEVGLGPFGNETERDAGMQAVDDEYRAKYQPRPKGPIKSELPMRQEELEKTWNKQTRFSYWAQTEPYSELSTTTHETPDEVQTERYEEFPFLAGFHEEEDDEKGSEAFVNKQFDHTTQDQRRVASSSQIPQNKTSNTDSGTHASHKLITTTVQNERKVIENVSRSDHFTTVDNSKTITQNDSQTTAKTQTMIHNDTTVMKNNQTTRVTQGAHVTLALNQSQSLRQNHSNAPHPLAARDLTANVTQSQPTAESQTNPITQNHTVSVTHTNTTHVTHTKTRSVVQNQTTTRTKNLPKSTVQNQTTKLRNKMTTKAQSQKTITTRRRETPDSTTETTQHRTQSTSQKRTKEEPITTTLK